MIFFSLLGNNWAITIPAHHTLHQSNRKFDNVTISQPLSTLHTDHFKGVFTQLLLSEQLN